MFFAPALGALVGLDGHLALGRDRGRAHEDLDLVLLHQVADAGVELLGHRARPLYHRIEVIADALGLQPEFLGAVHQVKDLRRPQHRLGRDAAPVQADAAHVLAFDDGDLEAQLAGTDGPHVTPRPCPDHHDIELLSGHLALLHLTHPSRDGLTLNNSHRCGPKSPAARCRSGRFGLRGMHGREAGARYSTGASTGVSSGVSAGVSAGGATVGASQAPTRSS
jgi:hypothetical protein